MRGADRTPRRPGPTYDLTFCEVRDTSLVLLWKAPVYAGSSPVSGYFVDYKEEGSEEWTTVSEAPTAHRYLKVGRPSSHCLWGQGAGPRGRPAPGGGDRGMCSVSAPSAASPPDSTE